MFDWHEYLRIAEELASVNDEGSQRSAISRAYYAAFHIARVIVGRTDLSVLGQIDAHKILWDKLKQDRQRERQHAGIEGSRLKKQRVDSDYVPEIEQDEESARVALRRAQRIISLLGG